MFKAVSITILAIGIAGAAATDTSAMQSNREKRVASRQEFLSAKTNREGLKARLRLEPLEPETLRDLGMLEPSRNDQVLLLAEHISRQDPVTQLILLQLAAKSGDLDGTLAHYDALLSTRQLAGQALEAQLANGLKNEEIAAKVKRLASRRWFPDFLEAATKLATDPRPVAILAQHTNLLHATDDRLTPQLLSALVHKATWRMHSRWPMP